MRKCPNCNLSIPKNSKKCEYCNTKISKEPKDYISKSPTIIETPNRIKESESLENTEEIKVNPIPLKVKPVTPPKKVRVNDINHPEKEIDKDYLKISFKLSFIVILVVLNAILIIKIFKDKEENEVKAPEQNIQTEHTTTEMLGSWRTSNNSLFIFDDELKFSWYEYYDELDNNYYSGTYNYKKGLEALTEMGYTEEEFTKTFTDIKVENVYSMNLLPTYSYKAGFDVTKEELKENETWWIIIMIKDDGTAIAYNKTLDFRYNLVKN